MGVKTPPYPNYPKWTTSRFFGFVRSALRKAWTKYPPKYEALKLAKVGKKTNVKTGRLADHYRCVECGKEFVMKDVQVDHIVDAGTLKTFDDIGSFCQRLFCSVNELQVLCKKCHKLKTYGK